MPLDCRAAYVELCNEILEPARAQFDQPFIITSGYRSPESNDQAHGIANSEHIATSQYCAADFSSWGIRAIFDWMRNNPALPFHQLILEHGQNSTVIHVSWNRLKPGVRSVLEGATHNAEPYVAVDHVEFNPSAPAPTEQAKAQPQTLLGADESTQT